MGSLSINEGHSSKDVWQNRCSLVTAILFGSRWSVLLQRLELQDAMSAVFKVYPRLMLNTYVDDLNTHRHLRNQSRIPAGAECGEQAQKCGPRNKIEVVAYGHCN